VVPDKIHLHLLGIMNKVGIPALEELKAYEERRVQRKSPGHTGSEVKRGQPR
jgi:hypothetical protein